MINISSIDALHPSMVGLAHYDASKHGVCRYAKTRRWELAQHKIWVNAVAPGGISKAGRGSYKPRAHQPSKHGPRTRAFLAKIPMGRMGETDEIGMVVLSLASEMSSYMTGERIGR